MKKWEGVIVADTYIKEIRIKQKKEEEIFIKYDERGIEKTLSNKDRAMPDFYNILNDLREVGIKILDMPFLLIKDRIFITGCKFKWKNMSLQSIELIGKYVLDNNCIDQKFFARGYNEYCLNEKELDLLENLQKQAIYYINNYREQIPLDQVDKENEEGE